MTTTNIGTTKIITERTWSYDSVRETCIRHHLYTCGTCREYERMLSIVEANSPEDIETLFGVAQDIVDHSDCRDGLEVSTVMYFLENEAVSTFFCVDTDEDLLQAEAEAAFEAEAVAEVQAELETEHKPGEKTGETSTYVQFNFGSFVVVGIDLFEGLSFEECVAIRSGDIAEYIDPQDEEWHVLTVTEVQAREHLLALRSQVALTYEEFQALAMENYCNGGDSIVECWGRQEFNSYVDLCGPITREGAMRMFKFNAEMDAEHRAAAKWASGEPEGGWDAQELEDEDIARIEASRPNYSVVLASDPYDVDEGKWSKVAAEHLTWEEAEKLMAEHRTTTGEYLDEDGHYWSAYIIDEMPARSPDTAPECWDEDGNYYEDGYEEKDYGPSNPWDAPGMSVSDFITGVSPF